ncbi:hypothetical protein N9948_01335 [bacterium]|nr:hypothetical protein [bacterium]
MSFGGSKKGFFDTKDFRINILRKSNERLGVLVKTIEDGNGTQVNKTKGLLALLDTTYKSDVPSTNYAMHLKAIAFESARAICISETARDDIYFETTRGEYFSQNIASFLFPNNNRFATTNKTDREARNFYLSIVEAYFGGSTKANIEKSLLRFLDGIRVGLVENFLLARGDSSLDPIINKFTFDILVNVDDPRITDVNQLQADIEFLLNIIKPAHTSFTTKLIFNEFFDFFAKGCNTVTDSNGDPIITHDGFELKTKSANTAICDVEHIDLYDYYYEDVRKPCGTPGIVLIPEEVIQDEDLLRLETNIFQAAPRIPRSVTGGNWESSQPNEFHTKYGPFAKEDGNLADTGTDITVTVDGSPATVSEIYPLSASFVLSLTPSASSLIKVTYYVLKDFTGALITNNPDSVINNWNNPATEHNYRSVLTPTGFNPIGAGDEFPIWEEQSKYKGFDLFNSSVMNCPLSLNLNEPDIRSRLNDYSVFKSFGYDLEEYNTTLREDTSLVPVSLDKKDSWKRLANQQFRMNYDEFQLNCSDDRLYGGIHEFSHHPFYSALEVESIDNGGAKGFLQSMCEDPVAGLQIDFARSFEESVTGIGKDWECPFYTYPSGSGFIPLSGFAILPASGFVTLTNDTECVIFGGGATWDIEGAPTNEYNSFAPEASGYPDPYPLVNYNFGGNHGQMHILTHDFYKEDYITLDVADTPPEVAEDIKNLPYDHIFNLTSFEKIEDRVHRIKDITKTVSLTFQTNQSILSINPSATAIIPGAFSTFTEVRNVTKAQSYDLTSMVLFGDKVFQLDESNATNISIGYDPGDDVYATFTAIDKMNDNHEVVRKLYSRLEVKFITSDPIYELLSVYNNTQTSFYDIANHDILGDRVINLTKDDPINSSIGFNTSDTVLIDYKKINTLSETSPATALPGNFLKLEINSVNEMLELLDVRNVTKGESYDLTDYSLLNENVILLSDDVLRNILIGQDPGDIFEVDMISNAGFITVTNEVAEVVESPYRFRFINVKPIEELISLTNVDKQLDYDLTDNSLITSSSGNYSSSNALLEGTLSTSIENLINKWESVGSNDTFTETLDIRFNGSKNLDSLALLDHNWKDFEVFYELDGNLANFSTPINVIGNAENNTVFTFDEVNTTRLFFRIHNTINSNNEKFIYRIIYLLQDIIELDNASVENHRVGLDFGDIVYSNSRASDPEDDIEPWLSYPRVDYNRSVFEIYPV